MNSDANYAMPRVAIRGANRKEKYSTVMPPESK